MPRRRPRAPDDLGEDVAALVARASASFLVRCVLRFVRIQGFDRSIVISSQVFTALIPLFILMTGFPPANDDSAVSDAIIDRFALTDDAAAAVHELFDTPPGATSGVTVFSALLLVYSGVAFTRRTQRMYRAAWEVEPRGVRSAVSAALGLVAILAGITVGSAAHSLAGHFPLDRLATVAASAVTGVLLWTLVPYLLLDREVHWRRLLVSGAVAALAMTTLGIATPVYMPRLIVEYAAQFGLFGITITLIGWLLVAAVLLVAAATVGAQFDASDAYWVLRAKLRFGLLDPALPRPTVPAGRDPRGLKAEDVRALVRVLVNWLIMSAAVWLATTLVPGITVHGAPVVEVGVALGLGLVNAVLGPTLLLALGLRSWTGVAGTALVVNVVLLCTTALLSVEVDLDGVGSALLGGAAIALAGALLTVVVRPVTDVVGLRRRPPDVRGDRRAGTGHHAAAGLTRRPRHRE